MQHCGPAQTALVPGHLTVEPTRQCEIGGDGGAASATVGRMSVQRQSMRIVGCAVSVSGAVGAPRTTENLSTDKNESTDLGGLIKENGPTK